MKNQMKETIADAFVALAKKKSIDKITVKDLVDYCDISRQSFYYHFQDILEVIEWHTQRIEEEVSARVRAADSFEDATRIMVSSFFENQELFKKLRDSQKRDFAEKLVMDSMQERFRQTVRAAAADTPLHMKPSEMEALISFFAFGTAGLMVSQFHAGKTDVDALTQQIVSVFRRLTPQSDPHQ